MSWIQVDGYEPAQGWGNAQTAKARGDECCAQLEAGKILYFPGVPFDFSQAQREALLTKRQSKLKFHKNISYRPKTGELRGFSSDVKEDVQELKGIVQQYSRVAAEFVARLLPAYAGKLELDYASFRPIEEQGRDLALHKRNDLLHVDSFPNRPTGGGRILRCFTNIHPTQTRNWMTAAEDFPTLAKRHARQAGLKKIARFSSQPVVKLGRRAQAVFRGMTGHPGMPTTGYDQFMLTFHDWMKENEGFQKSVTKAYDNFPPGSTWLVYTDSVPHAVLSGQFAIEQTFIVPVRAMVTPEVAPVKVLEAIAGERLA
jgi:hypothetical protein